MFRHKRVQDCENPENKEEEGSDGLFLVLKNLGTRV